MLSRLEAAIAQWPTGSSGTVLRRLCQTAFLCLSAGLILVTLAGAQVSTGALNGTVLDSSGSVLPAATVTLTNIDTGAQRTTVTTSTGTYVLPQVPPGRYNLAVTKKGFAAAKEINIPIAVNQTATINLTLKVGSTEQSVTVEANAAAVETATAGLGTVISQQQVTDLPLNGRNFTQLLTLTPGATPVSVSQNNSSNGFLGAHIGNFSFPAMNGQTNRSNFFLVDGINDQGVMGSTYAVAPIVDDIQEFKVQSHNDEAQFGGVTGGIVNVVTRSGTNTFHGTLWEYLRNTSLDASNPTNHQVPVLHQNQFGFNVGGPVLLPGYNGRNKTFSFISYEGYRKSNPANRIYTAPTAQELAGDFSADKTIYNPYTTRPDPNKAGQYLRDPFPNNQIDPSLFDPKMVKFAQTFFPQPNTNLSGGNYIDSRTQTTNQDQYNARVDEDFSSSDSAWFRWTGFHQPVVGPGSLPTLINTTTNKGYNWGASYLHTFSPTSIMQVQIGRAYAIAYSGSRFTNDIKDPTTLGFGKNFVCGFHQSGCLVPNIGISSYLSGGDSYNADGDSDLWEYRGDFTKIAGNHTFKAGVDLNTTRFNAVKEYVNDNFSTVETSNLETKSPSGNALASFLLGVPDSATMRNTLESLYGGKEMGFYFQDQWKASQRLTVNLGLRYDLTLIPSYGSAKDGNLGVGDVDLSNGTYVLQVNPGDCATTGKAPCIPGGTLPDHVVVAPNGHILRNTYDNIQPRMGIAYALNEKTAIHASYGIFFDNWAGVQQTAQNYEGSWPSVDQTIGNNINPTTPVNSAEDPLNLGSANPLPGPTPFNQVNWFVDPNIKNPMSQQWAFGVQRQVNSSTVLTLNYVGSHDTRVDVGGLYNTATTPGPGPVSARTPYPYIKPTYWDRSTGVSSYNGLQFSLNRHFMNGWSYLVSYTWSKSMDEGCSGYFGVEGCSIQYPYELQKDRSVSAYDLTHVLSINSVYQLPFGKGKRFDAGSPVANLLIGGWQVNGIMTMTSGLPFTITAPGDIANVGLTGVRANIVGNPNLSNPTTAEWFNTAAFQKPAPFTFGNLGRDSLRADWFKNVDFSLFRQFNITEGKRLEFRAEMFNATNTPTWGNPHTSLSDSKFGQVTGTRSSERQMQLSLKFYF